MNKSRWGSMVSWLGAPQMNALCMGVRFKTVTGLVTGVVCLMLSPFTMAVSLPKAMLVGGFSAERLQRLDDELHKEVDGENLAGTVYLLAHKGRVIKFNAYGQQNLQAKTPMQKNSIFRIFSMTKPITAVAMLMLYEEGRWLPSDPIEKYIPEFKKLKVYAGKNADGSLHLVAPTHAPIMGELMGHTAGFGLGFINSPVNELYQKADVFSSKNFDEFIAKIVALPLDYQPGTQWEYSVASDIQGYLVEKLSGIPFDEFLRQRIFIPLEMNDTAFDVTSEKLSRLATTYQPDANGKLIPMWQDQNTASPQKMLSGGGGLFSTAEDYWRFAQMLLDGGVYKGKRLLSNNSVKLMTANHVAEPLRDGRFGIGPYTLQQGLGFGYGLGVMDEPIKLHKTLGENSFFWIGAAGTWFWVDPANEVVFIGLSQRWMLAPGMPKLEEISQALVYQAFQAKH